MGKMIIPRRIVCEHNAENSQSLLRKNDIQVNPLAPNVVVQNCVKIQKGGFIVLDFGKELCGGIILAVQRVSGKSADEAKCRVVFGESVTEAMSKIGEKNSTNQHTMRDMVITAQVLSTCKVGSTGFRFVKLEALDEDIYLQTVAAECDTENFEYKGDFECNDHKINEIWKAGAYTVELNTHDLIWDGVKRDRIVWIGDMHPEASTINAVFGNVPAVRNSLDFVKRLTPPNEWMNSTATYSMWWIVMHYDLYMHWGDTEYLKAQEDYMMSLCDHIFSWADSDFESPYNTMLGFVDWSSKESDSELEGRRAITAIALDCAEKIFNWLRNEKYAKLCNSYVEKLRSEKIDQKYNKRVSALTVLSGRDGTLAREVLSGNSPEEMSCFMGYYVLKAKAALGEYSDALDIIRGYWGAMLDRGATTFWEDFDVRWLEGSGRIDEVTPDGLKDIHGDFGKYCYIGLRLSLCHGWASGPTPFLMEQIGGIEILEPGCKKVRINPNLGNLEWIKVVYPTPYGEIRIFAEQQNGETKVTYDAPEAITIVNNTGKSQKGRPFCYVSTYIANNSLGN